MRLINYPAIIEKAWLDFDPASSVQFVEDISAKVSTNHVFRVTLENGDRVIAKLSYFGKYEQFLEDHRIIHALANNLLYPFENVLAKSLVRDGQVYTYRHRDDLLDAWVVFYNPIRTQNKLPRRLDEHQIRLLGAQVARFHKACSRVSTVLPKSSKTLRSDIWDLLDQLDTETGQFEHRMHVDELRRQCDLFLANRQKLVAGTVETMPVFVDWNIGNFSVTENLELFSRWDYDWFRISYRVMDFYFFSRVSSDVGDRTIFSYLIDPMMEDRFLIFLQEYHKVYPLTEAEVRFFPEAYRFFILNYVIKYGRYFFHRTYATKLQREAYELYFPSIERFNADKILRALNL
ncbi:aminoglycoside phosphotransferase/kinase family protein [Spirosoma pomorum]|jgi:Ser/Thr protein kinase RdoA (MazF antagonist)